MVAKVLDVCLLFCIAGSFNPTYFSVTAREFIKCEDVEFRPICKGATSVMKYKSATYGRASSEPCPHPVGKWKHVSNMKCGMMNNVLKILQDKCDGKQRCPFPVTNEFFGFDPCPLTYKYLAVEFNCVPMQEPEI